ncbi:MAG: sulfurtransferase [Chloroflexi bacterium]|nr:sulfurtransferase [Chloroflexota bacterium]
MSDPRGPLVDPAWVQQHQNAPDLRLLDVRTAEQYRSGHLPGAAHLDIFALHWWDSSPTGLEQFRQQHAAALGAAGIRREDTVVVYSESSDMLAARGLWVLTILGQQRAYLLDGGLRAWQAAGGPLETGEPVARPVEYQAEWHPEPLAGWQDVLAALGRPGTVILDTRSTEEYTGQRVRAKRGGAIPGAIHLEYTANLGPDGRFKSPEELAALYRAHGITPDQEVIAYCHGGYRAANTWLALTLAGYPTVRNYISSWGEWGNRDDLPIEQPG